MVQDLCFFAISKTFRTRFLYMSPFREADGCTCAMDTRAGRYYTFFNMQNIGSHVAHVQQEGPPCVLGTDSSDINQYRAASLYELT